MTTTDDVVLAIVDLNSNTVVRRIPDVHVPDVLEGGALVLPPVSFDSDRVDSAMSGRRSTLTGTRKAATSGHRSRIVLAGVSVDLYSADSVRDMIRAALNTSSGSPLRIGSVNLDHVHHFGLRRDGIQRAIGDASSWLMTVDGAPIAWAARRLTGERQERVCGSDFLPEALEEAAHGGHRVGFLGGTEDTRSRLEQVLRQRFPGLVLAGHWIPEREELERPGGSAAIADEIRDAGVDLLVVGLGKPRQELWIEEYSERAGVRVALAFGAATDFLAGVVTRAPEWARSNGLEWFYRLSMEPRRLFRRYLLQGVRAFPALLSTRRELNSLIPSTPPTPESARSMVAPHLGHARGA